MPLPGPASLETLPRPLQPHPSLREGPFEGIVGYRVVSGTGEDLGLVIGIDHDANGRPRKIAFLEQPGDEPRHVHLRFVRSIGEGVVVLAGPRDGYHITRVRRAMPDLAAEEDGGVWGAT